MSVAKLNQEVNDAIAEQISSLKQIRTAMTQLDQVTQGNAAASEEAATSSELMAEQGVLLDQLVSEVGLLIDGSTKRLQSTSPDHNPENYDGSDQNRFSRAA